jgi:hypothetical protein
VRHAGERHQTRRGRGAQRRQQPGRQGEMAQEVGRELQLEPVGRGPAHRHGHDACIGDQEVQRPLAPAPRKGGDGGQLGHVQQADLQPRLGRLAADAERGVVTAPLVANARITSAPARASSSAVWNPSRCWRR